jgi:hypothetical protein
MQATLHRRDSADEVSAAHVEAAPIPMKIKRFRGGTLNERKEGNIHNHAEFKDRSLHIHESPPPHRPGGIHQGPIYEEFLLPINLAGGEWATELTESGPANEDSVREQGAHLLGNAAFPPPGFATVERDQRVIGQCTRRIVGVRGLQVTC